MRDVSIVLVAFVSVSLTATLAWRTWQAARRGAPRELQLGYLALMLVVGACGLLVLSRL